MKRQRKGSAKARSAAASSVKKKAKVVAAAAEERSPAEAEAEARLPTVEEMAEWASLWSGVDEEISWATSWCPFWEMMEGSSDAYDALYNDVLWDFDIWGLKTTIADPPPNP